MSYLQACRSIYRGSRTRGTISEGTGGNDTAINYIQDGPSTAPNPGTRRQQHIRWYRQQHNQETAITRNGNLICLASRSSNPTIYQGLLPARGGEYGDYPSKTHTAHIHKHVRPYYQQEVNSPRELPRATKIAHGEGVPKYRGISITRESHFPIVLRALTLCVCLC
jgi:hypothetical protein